jgi:His-Xaa-Ser system protein HxsD
MHREVVSMDQNMKYNKEENCCDIPVKTSLYPLDVIYTASYIFLDKAFISLDGDPDSEVLVSIRPKGQDDAKGMGKEFMNQLLFYAHYKNVLDDNKDARNMMLQRALITNMGPDALSDITREEESEIADSDDDEFFDDISDDDFLEDPEGIAIPWEEKYGKDKKNKETDGSDKQEKKDSEQMKKESDNPEKKPEDKAKKEKREKVKADARPKDEKESEDYV